MKDKFNIGTAASQGGLWVLAGMINTTEGVDPNVKLVVLVLLGLTAMGMQVFGNRRKPE